MNYNSEIVLNAVERWAAGYSMLRETGALCPDASRLDALLVPVSGEAHCMQDSAKSFFERPRFVGIEVKVTRPDFLSGLRNGQLEKYQNCVSGLYLVTWGKVCKTSEVPAGVGHILIPDKPKEMYLSCVCKRHPEYRDIETSPELPWRCLFRLHEQYRRKLAEEHDKFKKAAKRLGQSAAEKIFANIETMTARLELEQEQTEIVREAYKEMNDAVGRGWLF